MKLIFYAQNNSTPVWLNSAENFQICEPPPPTKKMRDRAVILVKLFFCVQKLHFLAKSHKAFSWGAQKIKMRNRAYFIVKSIFRAWNYMFWPKFSAWRAQMWRVKWYDYFPLVWFTGLMFLHKPLVKCWTIDISSPLNENVCGEKNWKRVSTL